MFSLNSSYQLQGGKWEVHQKLESPKPYFGWSVAIGYDVAITSSFATNSVYMFQLVNGQWEERTNLSDQVQGGPQIGRRVSLDAQEGRVIVTTLGGPVYICEIVTE